MTISNTSRTAGPFVGNGVTAAFPFAYKVFARSDVMVARTVTATGIESILTLDSDYTVTLNTDQNASPGGIITMAVPPPVGTTLAATSNISIQQSLDLTNNGGFYPTAITTALDRIVVNIQQLAARVGVGALNVGAAATLNALANLSTPTGSSLVGFPGSAGRTVKDQLDMLYYGVANVLDKQYAGGADPTNTVDSYAAIKAAAAAAQAGGKALFFPAGTYQIVPGQTPIDVTNLTLYGAGIYRSIVQVSGVNTQTTVFYNNKTSTAAWGTGGNLEIRSMSIRGNWDGTTALADQTWDNTAALVKCAAVSGLRLVDVQFYFSYGHNVAFYSLGYASFTRIKSTGAKKNGLHLEAVSGALGITSTGIHACDFNSNRGQGNIYIKNGIGVSIDSLCIFEDSLCGVYLDGNDNRNITITGNHAESCTNGILQFVGSGQKTVLTNNYADHGITRTNPAFQTLFAHSNQGMFNGIEEGFGPLLMDWDIGAGSASTSNYKLGFFGTPNFGDVLGRVSWRSNNNFGSSTPVAEIRGVARGNVNQAIGAIEFASGNNGLTYRARLDENGHFYPLVDNAYTCGASGQRWSAVWSATAGIQTSDQRAKTEITDSPLGLAFIEALRPVSYKYIIGGNKVEAVKVGEDADGNATFEDRVTPVPGTRAHFGLIAQEVKVALPEGVDFGGWVLSDIDKPDSEQGVRYEEFVAPLIKAVQELAARVRALEARP